MLALSSLFKVTLEKDSGLMTLIPEIYCKGTHFLVFCIVAEMAKLNKCKYFEMG